MSDRFTPQVTARGAPDRQARTRLMADVMREREAGDGACRTSDLRAAGFTEAEIQTYADDARAILSGCKPTSRVVSPARQMGKALVRRAKKIRTRIQGARKVDL